MTREQVIPEARAIHPKAGEALAAPSAAQLMYAINPRVTLHPPPALHTIAS